MTFQYDVIGKCKTSEDIITGSCVVGAMQTGNAQVKNPDIQNQPAQSGLYVKYNNRFDDVSYY